MTKLQVARLRRGWTQVQLSFHTGVPPAELSRLETGRVAVPFPAHAQRLAAVLEMAPSELLVQVDGVEAQSALEARAAR